MTDRQDLSDVHKALVFALYSSHPYPLTDHQAAEQAIEYYGATGLEPEGVRRRMGDLRDRFGWARWKRSGRHMQIEREGRRGLTELTPKGLKLAEELVARRDAEPGRLL